MLANQVGWLDPFVETVLFLHKATIAPSESPRSLRRIRCAVCMHAHALVHGRATHLQFCFENLFVGGFGGGRPLHTSTWTSAHNATNALKVTATCVGSRQKRIALPHLSAQRTALPHAQLGFAHSTNKSANKALLNSGSSDPTEGTAISNNKHRRNTWMVTAVSPQWIVLAYCAVKAWA